ncbi:MAG: histidine kinase dimerization/phospho-acceptor domain-containing protein [Woeseiaceae bacterium]|nr:histidine kinase dimerization/phospho-acceptor domain-containing protein [Woeseiaceae bacterium]
MNLRRQLLLVSLLTLLLPWAGCEFIRETEVALREGQQQMLAGTAQAIASSLLQFEAEFPRPETGSLTDDQLYIHTLSSRPEVDGYFDDWSISTDSLRQIRGTDGPIRFALGSYDATTFLYVEVIDTDVIYATPQSILIESGSRFADRVMLASVNPPYLQEAVSFAAEAPGPIRSYKKSASVFAPEPSIEAFWQDIPGGPDVPGGYRLEARIPSGQLGTHLGVVVYNTADDSGRGALSSSFSGRGPGMTIREIPELSSVAAGLVQDGMRLVLTDARGWRVAAAGTLQQAPGEARSPGITRRIYELLVSSGIDAELAGPDPLGREQQPYVSAALDGRESASWYRSFDSGRAIVAVAAPVVTNDEVIGAVILQQGTDAFLSLRNAGLSRLINLTLVTTIIVAAVLLGYATWLSRRIRALSLAAVDALEEEELAKSLPSALAEDEIGDLSRSFSWVLQQLGEYNEYLRTLASKLSHELRTPLAIVTSSLENLEHEPLNDDSRGYTERAREGADRLRRILNAMSEASRVEELMANAEPERFDLATVLSSTIDAYRDVYQQRNFSFSCETDDATMNGSPELVIQMLDKLADNAVDFSADGDSIEIGLRRVDGILRLSVANPGPALPDRMRAQLFDSMVSVRSGKDSRHLGIGLYIAKLIAEGHGGRIAADNIEGGVEFNVMLPGAA